MQIFLFPTSVFFLVGCRNKCGLWEIWNGFLTLLHQKQNDCHLRIVYQPYEDLLQVFLWITLIQTRHQCQLCLLVYLTHVYLLDSLKLSLRCKRVTVSFILVFVQSTMLFLISLWKYKWKVYLMFSILLALVFGVRQLILPEMVSHFCCLPMATGRSELHQIFFVFSSSFGPR